MARAAALARRNAATFALIDTLDPDTLTGVQLLASRPQELRRALGVLDEAAETSCPHWAQGIHGVDLNLGCPSPDVISHGAGPALLKRTRRLRQLFEVLAEWRASTKLPVGVIGAKMRTGMNLTEEEQGAFLQAVDAAAGTLDYVTLHARNAKDESSTPARWDCIRAAKEVAGSRLAVVGNGDAFTWDDAAAMVAETGCDAVLVARGAIRTGGLVFQRGWRGDAGDLAAAADQLEERYGRLARSFRTAGPRPKYAKFHREAFRRLRGRVGGEEGISAMNG